MGREIRRVPKDWVHPKSIAGYYVPLHDESYEEALADYNKEYERFEEIGPNVTSSVEGESAEGDYVVWRGKHYKTYPEEKSTFAEWHGSPPDEEYYRPAWKPEDRTHYQLYENVTEGTPISPVFAHLEQLEDWMVTNGDPVHGSISRRAAREFCKSGYAVSMAIIPGRGIIGGIQAHDDGKNPIRRRIDLSGDEDG